MTPRLSIIAASIRRVISALVSTASDYYWDNVVLAMKMDTGIDPEWGSTVLAMHMDDANVDPYWSDVVVALHMDGSDNGVVFTDEKGSTITAIGGTCTKALPKMFGTASAYFGGVSEFITVNDGSKVNFGTGDFTIEGWFLFSQISSQYIFGSRNSGLLQANLHDNLANKISIRAGGSYIFGTTPIVVDTWYHIAFVRSSGTSKFYLNGGLEGTIADTNNYETSQFDIGGASSLANYGLKGNIDDFRITKGVARYPSNFSVATSPFGSGSVFDDLKSHTITPVGAPSLSATHSKFGGKSALFNGTTDYLTIPTSTDFGFGTGDFTVECWVKTVASGTVLDLRSVSGDLGLFAINGGFISLWNGSTYLQGFTNVTTDAWVHLAWVRSAGVVSMFVNGVLDGISATSATFGTTRPVRIGADIVAANFFSGYIDDLRVSKVARYVDEFTPSKYPLLTGTSVPFLEETGKAATVVGNTVVNTTTKQYGTGSGYFDGAGDSLTVASSADTTFGSVDFTVEFWTKHSSAGTLLYIPYGASTTHAFIQLETDASSLYANISITGSSWASSVSYGALTTSTWSHIAVVRSGGFITIFLNGVKVGSSVNVGSASIPSTSLPITIGNRNDGASGVTGYIDDLRITKGVARYISNFTPAELATNKKTYLDPHWDKVVLGMHMDGADNGTTFTDVKGKTVVSVGGVVTKTATKKFGSASMKVAVHADYLSIGSAPDLSSGDYTIEFWVYLNQPFNIDHSNILVATDHVLASRWLIDVGHSSGQLNVRIATPLNAVVATYQGPHSLGTWAHIAYVNNTADSSFKVFLNGTQIGSRGLLALANSGPLLVGRNSPTWVAEAYYIDDLRITKGVARYTANFQPVQLPFPENYSGPLTIKSDPYWNNVVLAMHMDGANNGVVFTDVKGKTVTPTSAVTKTATKKFGTASAYFDGTGDYLTVDNSNDFAFGSDDFTIECWVYALSIPTVSNKFAFLITHDSIGITRGWELFLNDVTGPLGFLMFSNNTTYKTVMDTNPFPLNEWNHIAVSKNGPNLRLFRNGAMVAIDTTSNITIQNPNVSVLIGSNRSANVVDASGSWNFNGYIDDLRVTKGVARYTENFVPVGSFPEVLMS